MRTVEYTRQGGAAQGLMLREGVRRPAEDGAFAHDLAQNKPDLLDVAASYDLADLETAIEHARRPAKSGTVLLTTPRTVDSGHGAA